jgi:hypothetical protein
MFPAISYPMPESRKAPGQLENLDTMSTLLVLVHVGMRFSLTPSLLWSKCNGTGWAGWVSLLLGESSVNSWLLQ